MKWKKKVLSLLLAMCLTAGMLPMAAFAVDEPQTRTEQANDAALPFTDVSEDDWFYPYVKYAYEHGLMSGTSATTFGPQMAVNRAMVVQILYAQAGKPATSGESSFSDVKEGDWYYDAVVWAEQTGVTAGEDGKFNPNQSTTREQFAVMLYANAGKPAASGDLSGFADVDSVSSWAQPGMTWANQNGLISGEQRNGAMYLNPQGLATRAQGATIFKAYNENVLGITEVARGTCGENLTWTLDNNGQLLIKGTGKMDDWESSEDAPWYANRDQIKIVYIGDGVTSIGDAAFVDYYNLTSVTIGSGVTSIGEGAFYYCSSLTSVTIPDSVTSIGEDAFYYCDSLTSVAIGSGVTSIGDSAFYYRSSLTSVAIPDSVTSIGKGAFYYCPSLTSVTIGSGVTSIGSWAFDDCYDLTDVYYRGSEAQWAAIEIGDKNDPLWDATIHYNYEG